MTLYVSGPSVFFWFFFGSFFLIDDIVTRPRQHHYSSLWGRLHLNCYKAFSS